MRNFETVLIVFAKEEAFLSPHVLSAQKAELPHRKKLLLKAASYQICLHLNK